MEKLGLWRESFLVEFPQIYQKLPDLPLSEQKLFSLPFTCLVYVWNCDNASEQRSSSVMEHPVETMALTSSGRIRKQRKSPSTKMPSLENMINIWYMIYILRSFYVSFILFYIIVYLSRYAARQWKCHAWGRHWLHNNTDGSLTLFRPYVDQPCLHLRLTQNWEKWSKMIQNATVPLWMPRLMARMDKNG